MLGFSSLSETPFSTLSGAAIRLESSAILDSSFLVSAVPSLTYFQNQTFHIESNLLAEAINRSNISADLISSFELSLDNFIRLQESASVSTDFNLDSSGFIKVLSDVILQSDFDIKSDPLIKILGSTDFNSEINFIANPTNISFNSADFEIIAAFQANFSQVNGDVVYYIVYTDKVKSFNMNILRVK